MIQLAEWPPSTVRLRAVPRRHQAVPRRHLLGTDCRRVVDPAGPREQGEGRIASFVKQVDPLAHKGWRGPQQTSGIDTLLTTADSSKAFLTALRRSSDQGIRDLIDSQGHTDCCYVGEVGRSRTDLLPPS